MKKWTFKKFLLNLAINGWSVAKYTKDEKIKLVREHTNGETGNEMIFDTINEYDSFIENTVDYSDQFCNTARALNTVFQSPEGSAYLRN